jgi:hypothetical protein
MPFNVSEFRSHISSKNGLARPALFEVIIPMSNAVGRDLTLQCESAELTGKSLQTADVKIYGPTFKIPYQTSFQEITFTFVSTNKFTERQIFESWIQNIMPLSTHNLRFPKEPGYYTDVLVYQYNEAGTKIMEMKLIDSYPISIAPQALSWAEDGFHRLQVQFTFTKYNTIFYN